MPLMFPYDSRQRRLEAFVELAATACLYTNDILVNSQTKASDFIEPPSETGYRPLALSKFMWRMEPVGTTVRAVADPIRWAFTAPRATICGYYAVDAAGELLWAERFEEDGKGVPFEVLRPKDELEVTVNIDAPDDDGKGVHFDMLPTEDEDEDPIV